MNSDLSPRQQRQEAAAMAAAVGASKLGGFRSDRDPVAARTSSG